MLKNFKFRAVGKDDNKLIYGNGIVSVEENNIQHTYLLNYYNANSFCDIEEVEVIPDSVEQLICFDDEGKEIFENDFIQDAEKNNYKAVLLPSFWNEKNNSYIPVWRAKNIFLEVNKK